VSAVWAHAVLPILVVQATTKQKESLTMIPIPMGGTPMLRSGTPFPLKEKALSLSKMLFLLMGKVFPLSG